MFSIPTFLASQPITYGRHDPNQKNIYDAALALIAIMYGIMQGIIAVASLLATMALYGNGRDPQWCMSGIHNMYYSYHCSLIGQSTIYKPIINNHYLSQTIEYHL